MPDPRDTFTILVPPANSTVGDQFTAYGACSAIYQGTTCKMKAYLVIPGSDPPIIVDGVLTFNYANGTWAATFSDVPAGSGATLYVTCTGLPDQTVTGLTTGSTAAKINTPTGGQVFTNWGDNTSSGQYSPEFTVTAFGIAQAGFVLPAPTGAAGRPARVTPTPGAARPIYETDLLKSIAVTTYTGSDFVVYWQLTNGTQNLFVSSGLFTVQNAG